MCIINFRRKYRSLPIISHEWHGISNHRQLSFLFCSTVLQQRQHQVMYYWLFMGRIHQWYVDSLHSDGGSYAEGFSLLWRHHHTASPRGHNASETITDSVLILCAHWTISFSLALTCHYKTDDIRLDFTTRSGLYRHVIRYSMIC